MEDLEKVYDDQISPLVAQILAICKENKMPLFMDFRLGDDLYCKSVHAPITDVPHFNLIYNLYEMLGKCRENGGVNIDKFFLGIKRSNIVNESSIVMKILDKLTET